MFYVATQEIKNHVTNLSMPLVNTNTIRIHGDKDEVVLRIRVPNVLMWWRGYFARAFTFMRA